MRQTVKAAAVVLRNLLWGGNIASLSLRQPRKMLECVWESLFIYQEVAARRCLPGRHVYEVLSCPPVVSVNLGGLNADGGFGFPPSSTIDIISLCLICRLLRPKVVFEIGTLFGHTTVQLALNTPDDAKIYTLDLPPDVVQPRLRITPADDAIISSYRGASEWSFFNQAVVASKIIRLFGDSADFDYSPYHGQVDFFFIDGIPLLRVRPYGHPKCDAMLPPGERHSMARLRPGWCGRGVPMAVGVCAEA